MTTLIRRFMWLIVSGTVLLAPISTPSLNARLREAWSFEKMLKEADLVAIARVIESKENGEAVSLPDFDAPVKVIPMLTEFEARLVFKGPKDIRTFKLFHYRYLSEEEEFAVANGPQLVRINSGEHPAFLLFLVKDHGGQYVPLGGQIDAAALSVLDLRGGGD